MKKKSWLCKLGLHKYEGDWKPMPSSIISIFTKRPLFFKCCEKCKKLKTTRG